MSDIDESPFDDWADVDDGTAPALADDAFDDDWCVRRASSAKTDLAKTLWHYSPCAPSAQGTVHVSIPGTAPLHRTHSAGASTMRTRA